jgi:hypothetical protein
VTAFLSHHHFLEKRMKKIIALVLTAGAIGSAAAQPSIGVSIGINQPGVYGRINIGDIPPPALVAPRPVIIAPSPIAAQQRPIYLYVPPAYQQNWGRYCGRYNACGQPVYFVRDQWVRERYEHDHPGWNRGHRGPDRHDGRGPGRGHGHDHDHH